METGMVLQMLEIDGEVVGGSMGEGSIEIRSMIEDSVGES